MPLPPPPAPLRFKSNNEPVGFAPPPPPPTSPPRFAEFENHTSPAAELPPSHGPSTKSSNKKRPVSPLHGTSNSAVGAAAQLRQAVQELTAENAVLQQRVRALMEGDALDEPTLPGMAFATAAKSEETAVLLLRIKRLEAALRLEAMEREAMEIQLQAQERVLAKLLSK